MVQTFTDNATVAPLYNAISDIVMSQVNAISEFELIRMLQRPPYELLSSQALRASLDLFQTHFLVFHCLHRLRIEWQREGVGWLRIEPLAIQLVTERVGDGGRAPSANNDSGENSDSDVNSDPGANSDSGVNNDTGANCDSAAINGAGANSNAAETASAIGGDLRHESRVVGRGATGALQPSDRLASYYLDLENLHATGVQDVERLLDSFWQALGNSGARSNAPESRVGRDSERQRREALRVLKLAAMPDEPAQLKRQFRMLLHQYHPDKGGSNTEFRRLQWAYQVVQAVLP